MNKNQTLIFFKIVPLALISTNFLLIGEFLKLLFLYSVNLCNCICFNVLYIFNLTQAMNFPFRKTKKSCTELLGLAIMEGASFVQSSVLPKTASQKVLSIGIDSDDI